MTAATAPVINEEDYLRGLARAAAGAVIFGFPLLMTMEMWTFGFTMDRTRLALFVVVIAGVVFGLSSFTGFRETDNALDDGLDALAALFVGFTVSALMLGVLGVITTDMPLREIVGNIAVQGAPASIGAILAGKQLQMQHAGGDTKREDRAGYAGQLFLLGAGATFLAFNVAPTEEMIVMAYKMTPWHAIALILTSLVLLHALVYAVGFGGQEKHESHARALIHFTIPGYAIALLVSLYVLWTFGRLEGMGPGAMAHTVVVLAFPASLGAAAARLLV